MDSIAREHIKLMVGEARAKGENKRQFYDDIISFVNSIWADPMQPPAPNAGGCPKCEKDIEP